MLRAEGAVPLLESLWLSRGLGPMSKRAKVELTAAWFESGRPDGKLRVFGSEGDEAIPWSPRGSSRGSARGSPQYSPRHSPRYSPRGQLELPAGSSPRSERPPTPRAVSSLLQGLRLARRAP
ncbi:unnamed protein product [Prorocentrum cordatum]|uniref:Uncharacterized protein n=1 Tax=Prorocentrum cordatum TaxID=2364126 RepID=A0ABN9UP99_9DINO|nr:unnamed protein product [Polarella glacialis]